MSAATSATSAEHARVCHPVEPKTETDEVLEIVEKLTVVALAVFACYMNWRIFVPYFLIGTGLGFYGYYKEEQRLLKELEACPDGSCGKKRVASCSQGFIEGITGVELEKPVAIAANTAITICHIDHHPHVFLPLTALLTGAWFGKNLAYYGAGFLGKRINPVKQQRVSVS